VTVVGKVSGHGIQNSSWNLELSLFVSMIVSEEDERFGGAQGLADCLGGGLGTAWFVSLVICFFSLEFSTYGYDNHPRGVLD
jgi:hypothetical protein